MIPRHEALKKIEKAFRVHPRQTIRRFWTMVAHYHGQVWNAAEFARSMGTVEKTARRYLDILSGAYMIRVLSPWFQNMGKRQVKAPKIYIRDTGILHTLLQVQTLGELQGHPKLGSSWEGFALEQVINAFDTRDAYFWATHAGAELDLLLMARGRRFGLVTFKSVDMGPIYLDRAGIFSCVPSLPGWSFLRFIDGGVLPPPASHSGKGPNPVRVATGCVRSLSNPMSTLLNVTFGFEFKYADAPERSRSMLIALEDQKLEYLWIVYPGDQEYSVDKKITVSPLREIAELPSRLSRKKAKKP